MPPFSPFQVLQAMTHPGQFRSMTDQDYAAFNGASDETLIGTVSGHEDQWLVLIGIDTEGALRIEAFGADDLCGGFYFERGGWVAA